MKWLARAGLAKYALDGWQRIECCLVCSFECEADLEYKSWNFLVGVGMRAVPFARLCWWFYRTFNLVCPDRKRASYDKTASHDYM